MDLTSLFTNREELKRMVHHARPSYYIPAADLPGTSRTRSLYKADIEAFREQLAQGQTPGDTKSMLVAWCARTVEIYQNVNVYREWQEIEERKAAQVHKEMQKRRREDILDKMRALGFQAEVGYLGLSYGGLTGTMLELVNRPYPLTSKGKLVSITAPSPSLNSADGIEWSRIKASAENWFMRWRVHQERLHERTSIKGRLIMLQIALEVYSEDNALGDFSPHPVDLAQYEEVRIISQLDPTVTINLAAFSRLLPTLINRWSSAREIALRTLAFLHHVDQPLLPSVASSNWAMKTRSTHQHHVAPLDLAAAVFHCAYCYSAMHWKSAAAHQCLYGHDPAWEDTKEQMPFADGYIPEIEGDLYHSACLMAYQGRQPWSTEGLRGCFDLAARIITACGLNPSHATAKDLDRHNSRIACGACSIGGRTLVVMGWRRAILHSLRHHGNEVPNWVTVPAAIQTRSETALFHHLQTEHSIPMATLKDYMEYRPIDDEWFTHPPVVFISSALKGSDLSSTVADYERLAAKKRVAFTGLLGKSGA
ncbi:hypothetical protein C8Q76DRAFT_798742 [Earliella scabrosa]|nr:hypothetical protein C8Q76DRAFT_798742 [Earliella scabrosa]